MCKDQESIQSSTTPDPGYQWESDKTNNWTPRTRVKRSALSQQVTARHIQTDERKGIANTRQKKHKKRSTKEVPPWNGQ